VLLILHVVKIYCMFHILCLFYYQTRPVAKLPTELVVKRLKAPCHTDILYRVLCSQKTVSYQYNCPYHQYLDYMYLVR
jgi:hypothetical protein